MLKDKIGKINPIFFSELKKIIALQLLFQLLYFSLIYLIGEQSNTEVVQYINNSSYFLFLLIALFSLKYTLANRPLVILFAIQYFYLVVVSFTWLLGINLPFNLETIITTGIVLQITSYLFFYSVNPKRENITQHFIFSIGLTLGILLLTYSNIDIFTDYSALDYDSFFAAYKELGFNTYYVYIINLSFLIFIWFTYNQGQFVLSEYLTSILSFHTLLVSNEIYQLYNLTHIFDQADENFIDGQYFNTIVNVGLIIIWFIRLEYLTKPSSKKNEHYVLNYDLLKGFVDKPHSGFWNFLLKKVGKQKFFRTVITLLVILSIPLLFLGDLSYYSRLNILLMIVFVISVLIYAVVHTQKKWANKIGFMVEPKKSNQDINAT